MKRTVLVASVAAALCSQAHADDFFTPMSPAAVGEARSVYGVIQTFSASDAVPISQQNKDWSVGYRPRSGTNATLESTSYELGVQWQGYRLGYFERSEWTALASRDFVDDVHGHRTGVGLDPGRLYALDYKARGFTADGLKLTKSFVHDIAPRWQFGWGAAVSFLRGTSVQREDIGGSASAAGTTVNWVRTYAGTNRGATDTSASLVPGAPIVIPPGSPTGQGYAVDLAMGFVHESGLRIDWVATDALARMKWKDILQTTLTGSFDAAGNPNGVVLGHLPQRVTFNESLPIKQSIALTVPSRIANFEISDTVYQGLNMPMVGLSKRLDPDWSTRLDYDVRFSTVGLGLSYRWLYLSLRTDSLSPDRAHAYGGSIGARLDF